MKKTIFLLAFILPICSLLAQTPIDRPLDLTLEDGNIGIVDQIGTLNTGSIDQQGEDNYSLITQRESGNTATVVQEAADPDANAALSIVNQTGSENTATVTQIHTATPGAGPQGIAEAYVEQSGNGNDATQVQGPDNKLGSAWMLTVQTGDGNTSEQEQNSYYNEAFINQTGKRGIAKQYQDRGLPVGYEGATSNLAIIDQGGEENEAYQIQNGHANDVYSFQTGKGNYSHQIQGNEAATSWVGLAIVNQTGDKNDADQSQYGSVNNAFITQTSNDNEATQSQTNTGGGVNPYHAANSAHIVQMGGDGNVAEQEQTIDFNTAPIGGDPYDSTPMMYPNVGHIYQDGNDNEAYQTQTGGYNVGLVIQDGDGNVATVTQSQNVIPPPL